MGKRKGNIPRKNQKWASIKTKIFKIKNIFKNRNALNLHP